MGSGKAWYNSFRLSLAEVDPVTGASRDGQEEYRRFGVGRMILSRVHVNLYFTSPRPILMSATPATAIIPQASVDLQVKEQGYRFRRHLCPLWLQQTMKAMLYYDSLMHMLC